MVIRASCNDLLLVSPHLDSWTHIYYICNPITRQFYQLPEIPQTDRYLACSGQALICMPNNEFKIVVLGRLRNSIRVCSQNVMIFSSKTGTWESKCLEYPNPRERRGVHWLEMITCNGVVYWLEHDFYMNRVLSLDLRNDNKVGTLDFPDDYWWYPRRTMDLRKHHRIRGGFKGDHVKTQIGVVSGELWLLQFVNTSVKGMINLKAWRLNNGSEWILVEDRKNLKDPVNKEGEEEFVGGFTHPLNNEALILVWGRNIFEYNLMDGSLEILGVLQEYIKVSNYAWYKDERLVCIPVMPPTWLMALRPHHRASKSL
ncbi:Unknown protein [Striga hermonthica]|uniref:F-box protein At3g26010-like beta-propeller domain-containing protein n=1 Tax=Striga hermonthica TaxID=68872 RepID=A0A9N7NAB0_STRHE|nr:Unknown protein [Striga hermonthica]